MSGLEYLRINAAEGSFYHDFSWGEYNFYLLGLNCVRYMPS